jgi:hypothetical protein
MQQSSDSGNPYIVPLHTAVFSTVRNPQKPQRMHGKENRHQNFTRSYGDSRSLIVSDDCSEKVFPDWHERKEFFDIPNMHIPFKLDEIYTRFANQLPTTYGRRDLCITILEDRLEMAGCFDNLKISVGENELAPDNSILLRSGDVILFYASSQAGRYPHGNNMRGLDKNGRDWTAVPYGPLFQIQYVTSTL